MTRRERMEALQAAFLLVFGDGYAGVHPLFELLADDMRPVTPWSNIEQDVIIERILADRGVHTHE